MHVLTAKRARETFSSVLDAVAAGKTLTITRRGKAVARLTPVAKKPRPHFPDLTEFRAAQKAGTHKIVTVEDLRRAERF